MADAVSPLLVQVYFECKADVVALGWMADVMSNGIATIVHNMLHKILLYFCVIGETATVADVRPPYDEHVGRSYVWEVDGKTTFIKGANYFSFSSHINICKDE